MTTNCALQSASPKILAIRKFTLCQHLCSLLLTNIVESNLSIVGSRGLQARGRLFISSFPFSSSSSLTKLSSSKPSLARLCSSRPSRSRGDPSSFSFLSTFCGASMTPLFTLVGPPHLLCYLHYLCLVCLVLQTSQTALF